MPHPLPPPPPPPPTGHIRGACHGRAVRSTDRTGQTKGHVRARRCSLGAQPPAHLRPHHLQPGCALQAVHLAAPQRRLAVNLSRVGGGARERFGYGPEHRATAAAVAAGEGWQRCRQRTEGPLPTLFLAALPAASRWAAEGTRCTVAGGRCAVAGSASRNVRACRARRLAGWLHSLERNACARPRLGCKIRVVGRTRGATHHDAMVAHVQLLLSVEALAAPGDACSDTGGAEGCLLRRTHTHGEARRHRSSMSRQRHAPAGCDQAPQPARGGRRLLHTRDVPRLPPGLAAAAA